MPDHTQPWERTARMEQRFMDALAKNERLRNDLAAANARIEAAITLIDSHDGADAQFTEHWKWTEVRDALYGTTNEEN